MNKCDACGAEHGHYHNPGCDMEPCAVCKIQKIACDCETPTAVLVPVGWNPVHDSDLWLEYLTPIHSPILNKGVSGCGLCGNKGVVKTIHLEEIPCICPNGRAIKQGKYGEN